MELRITTKDIWKLFKIYLYPSNRVAEIVDQLNNQARSIIQRGTPDQPGATMMAMAENRIEPVKTMMSGTINIGLPAGALTIGRSLKSDICVADPLVSRAHATLTVHTNGKVTLRDLASSNGTFVNGRRVIEAQLTDGDIVRVGQTELVFG